MKSPQRSEFTFIQDAASPTLQEQIVAHLGTTGQFPTLDPSVFAAPKIFQELSAGMDTLEPEKSLPMLSHTFMEIFYYISGNNIGFLIGSHRYVLQKGDIVIIPPGVWHCTLRTSRSTEPCTRYLIAPKASYIQKLGSPDLEKIASHMEQPYLLRTAGTPLAYLERLFALCCREDALKAPFWREILDGSIRILFANMLRASQTSNFSVIKAQKDGIFEKSLSYVDEHLTEKLTLAETAQSLFTSERTITREFQKNMGISFYRYVTIRRLELSRNLLEGSMPLEDISEAVGFSDYPTFYRAFKKHFGCSPRQMRQGDPENG